jgi:hypothetical protein
MIGDLRSLPPFINTPGGIIQMMPQQVMSNGLPSITALYPRGGTDMTSFWSGRCPNCWKVYKVYSQGGYVCYAKGQDNPVPIQTWVVFGVDVSVGDPSAQALIDNGWIIES